MVILKSEVEAENQTVIHVFEDKCTDCGSTDLIYDYDVGETICKACGLVVQNPIINRGPEWRAFTLEEKKSKTRVGPPTSYSIHDKGLSTSIRYITQDAHGRKLPLSTRNQMRRLKKWQTRSSAPRSIARNLSQAMSELDRLSDKLHIPRPVKEKAAVIYRKFFDKGLVAGRAITNVIAASLYTACRVMGVPRDLREISEASLGSWKDVARCYRIIIRELKIYVPISNPILYLSKIAVRAGVSGQTQGLAAKLIQEAKKKGITTGKNPVVMAATALYIACKLADEPTTQKEIAKAAGITEVAIRNRHKTLKKKIEI